MYLPSLVSHPPCTTFNWPLHTPQRTRTNSFVIILVLFEFDPTFQLVYECLAWCVWTLSLAFIYTWRTRSCHFVMQCFVTIRIFNDIIYCNILTGTNTSRQTSCKGLMCDLITDRRIFLRQLVFHLLNLERMKYSLVVQMK